MPISCVYCGSSHPTTAEVRACWQRTNGHEAIGVAPTAAAPEPAHLADTPPARSTLHHPDRAVPAGVRLTDLAERWAGPDALGRLLVVLDPTDDPVPAPWSGVEQLTISTTTVLQPADAVAALRTAHQQRRRLVVRLEVALHRHPGEVLGTELHEVGPRGELLLDELHHLVWSNSVVLDHDGARWPWAERAVTAGALTAHADGQGHPAGDVTVPGIGPVWIDGGPLRHHEPLAGIPVVPAAAVEHGSLVPFGTNHCAAALAPDQLAAVTHPGGSARIVAPAGSGKTRVLTERVRHLVQHWHLPPSAITLVAYNRRAQVEMQQRLTDVAGIEVRTLNSLALAIVNGVAPFAPRPQRLTTLDERGVRRILDRFVPSARRRNVDPLAPWLEALSAVRLGLRSPAEVEDDGEGDLAGLTEVVPHFEAALAAERATDFDGQITSAIRLLLTDPAVRLAAQRACRVLLVDEFQDLTPAHLLFIRLLAAPQWAVFGVGDDDQTIYGYNGASPDWLIDYASLFPGAGDHPLEVNYRCPGDVVQAVDLMLRRNTRRVAKTIRAAHEQARGLQCTTSAHPVERTVEAVMAAVRTGAAPSEVAVLARVNVVLVPVQVALHSAGIPATTVAGDEFLQRTSVRSAVAWLHLARAPARALPPRAVTEALSRPSRSLSPRVASWAAEQTSVRDLRRLADRLTTEREARAVGEFADDIEVVQQVARHGTTAQVLQAVTDQLGLAGTLATFDRNRRGMNATSQSDDLTALAHLAQLQPDVEAFPTWLAQSLGAARSTDGVTLATVHRVKGQEWPHVVVHLADESQFPHRLADDLAEERRLFHVALTRTSQTVTVVATAGSPSPFLTELDRPPSPADRPLRTTADISTVAGRGRPPRTPPADPAELMGDDAVLYEVLRAVRERLRNGKPAYTVFDNATLAAIARARPTSLTELSRLRGVGPMKLQQFGESVLAAVADHLAGHG